MQDYQRTIHYLLLRSEQALYALELRCINKVLPLMALKQIPQSPHYLAGIFNYQGGAVPVIDLSLRMGEEFTRSYNCDTMIILCKANDAALCGIIAVDINEIIAINSDALQLVAEFSEKYLPFSAIFYYQQAQCLVLNTDVLLSSSFACLNNSPREVRALLQRYLR